MTKKYRYTLLSFVGLTIAMIANVRSIPTIAATGWQQIPYILFGLLCFALPVCLIAAEFGTTFPGTAVPSYGLKKALAKNGALSWRGYHGHKCSLA